jgi:hypothetical protein
VETQRLPRARLVARTALNLAAVVAVVLAATASVHH